MKKVMTIIATLVGISLIMAQLSFSQQKPKGKKVTERIKTL